MVTIMREQELRRTIPKHEANAVYLRALERDDLETARAILDAPGAPWVSDEVRRRGEDAYAERTNPKAWETVQSLEYLHAHLDSLAGQTRTWFVALGASKESIQKTIGG